MQPCKIQFLNEYPEYQICSSSIEVNNFLTN